MRPQADAPDRPEARLVVSIGLIGGSAQSGESGTSCQGHNGGDRASAATISPGRGPDRRSCHTRLLLLQEG
jgi:hypothetical protein